MSTGYTLLETVEELNAFIDGQHYEACKWAKEVNPAVSVCFECPFPVCVDHDLVAVNKTTKTKYIEELKTKGVI